MSHLSSRPVFVVLEGLDGSGKSTCASALAAKLGAVLMATPAGGLRQHRECLLASFDGCQEAAQHLYQAAVFDASCRVRRLLDGGTSVVLDRYFLSTEAYAAFRGSRIRHDEQCSLLTPADLTVFLHAPLAVRQERILRRGVSTSADRETLTETADALLRREHELRACLPVVGRFLSVDTSRSDPPEVVKRILLLLVNLAASLQTGEQDAHPR